MVYISACDLGNGFNYMYHPNVSFPWIGSNVIISEFDCPIFPWLCVWVDHLLQAGFLFPFILYSLVWKQYV